MIIRTPIAIVAAAALLLVPATSAHAGMRQAWDVHAVSGSYTITGSAAEEIGCPGGESTPEQQVIASKYDVAFEGTGVSGKGPWIKYFPYLRGPASPGPVGVKFSVTSKGTESVRSLSLIGEPGCTQADAACEASDTAKTGKGSYAIGAKTSGKSVDVGLPIIGSTPFLVGCDDEADGHDDPHHETQYSGSISPFISEKVPLSSFKKGSLVITFKGSQGVRGKGRGVFGWTGQLAWNAKLKLRKVVLSEGCKELNGTSGFVCSP